MSSTQHHRALVGVPYLHHTLSITLDILRMSHTQPGVLVYGGSALTLDSIAPNLTSQNPVFAARQPGLSAGQPDNRKAPKILATDVLSARKTP